MYCMFLCLRYVMMVLVGLLEACWLICVVVTWFLVVMMMLTNDGADFGDLRSLQKRNLISYIKVSLCRKLTNLLKKSKVVL